MKNLGKLTLVLLLAVSFNFAGAQNEDNPWAISFGINAVDFYPTGEDAPLGGYFDEFFNATDHYNILPSISTLTVSRYLSDNFSFGVAGSINRIDKFGDASVDDLTYYGLDGIIKYSFANVIKSKKLEPHLGIGGGYTWVDDIGRGTLNGSAGLTYWFTRNIGLSVQSTYKHSFEDALASHFQHTAGISIQFGGKDTDGDGIYDKHDKCPEVAGLEAFDGCPDSDNDGIEDSKDECPNEAGLAEFNGCADTDKDGVANNKDECPTVAGVKELNGCPDADKDGVTDSKDKCVNEAGPAANNGCPWLDTDKDGVLDKDDKCPNEVGTVANNGCPELPNEEVQKQLSEYANVITFNTNRSSFKKEAFKTLVAITGILKEFPQANFKIEGHTDSTGSSAYNTKLSNERANAVLDYLVENGIAKARLSAQGFGEDAPKASNKTRAGRAENRRVEIKLAN